MTHKPGAVFAYLPHPFLLARAFFQGIEPDKCHDLFFSPKSPDIAQRVDQCQSVYRPYSGMRHQKFDPLVLRNFLEYLFLKSLHLTRQLVVEREPRDQKETLGIGPLHLIQFLPAFNSRQAKSRESFSSGICPKLICKRRPLSHQRLTIVQQIECLSALRLAWHYCRK